MINLITFAWELLTFEIVANWSDYLEFGMAPLVQSEELGLYEGLLA